MSQNDNNVVNSRFSNWSYHDFGVLRVFGAKPDVTSKKLPDIESVYSGSPSSWSENRANPHNWPLRLKVLHFVVPIVFAFISSLSSTAITPSLPKIQSDFRVAAILCKLAFSTYLFGLAAGFFLGGIAVTAFARRPLLLTTVLLYGAATLATGLSINSTLLLSFRFLAGIFAGAAVTTCSVVISDLWSLRTRDVSRTFFYGAYFVGPVIGPLVGALIADKKSWRWTQFSLSISCAPLVFLTFLMRETSERVILDRLHRANDEADDSPKHSTNASLGKALSRSFGILFTKPAALVLGLWVGLALAVQFALYVSLPGIFGAYKLRQVELRLCFFSLAIGALVGMAVHLLLQSRLVQGLTGRFGSVGDLRISKLPARYRLAVGLSTTITLPVSILFFAFTIPKSSLLVPLALLTLFGASLFLGFMAALLYLVDRFDSDAEGECGIVAGCVFLFLVHAVAGGLPLGMEGFLKVVSLRAAFGILAGSSGVMGFAVWMVWFMDRRKATKG